MRYIKSILLALIFSVAILGGFGLLLKPTYKVEKSIIIKASQDTIFPFLINLKKWPEWSAWSTHKDPSVKITFEGPKKGIGAKQKWEGESIEGELEITGFKDKKELNYDFKLEEDFISRGTLLLQAQGSNTKITWKIEGDVGYNLPQRYFILFIDKLEGPDMEEGLVKLKKICERE